ncbi:Polyprotein, partial [Hondaea fermentalgiana]
YCVLFTDEFSKYRAAFFYPTCSGVTLVHAIKAWRRQWLTALRGDPTPEGLEIVADAAFDIDIVREQLDLYNWTLTLATPFEHATHGIAERSVGIVAQKARTLLADCRLGPRFWDDAVACAVWTINRIPHSRTKRIPVAAHGIGPADLSPARRFGTLVAFKDHLANKG